MLTFPDGTQTGVMGLNEILAAVYDEGGQVSRETAEEIVERLAVKNYILASVRREYCDLLVEEYRKYVNARSRTAPVEARRSATGGNGNSRRGFLSKLLKVFGRLYPH
jgi:hypothetical protein